MKTFRGWLVIIFSMVGMYSWAESLDPLSDEAETIESFDELSPESIERIESQIEIRKKLNQDIGPLELKLNIIRAKATDNGRS